MHPRVLAELPGQLSLPHIHRPNLTRAMLEQAIGKASGGRSEVDCPPSGGINAKMVQCMFQFLAAAADISLRKFDDKPVIRLDCIARFGRSPVVDSYRSSQNSALGFFP